MRFRLLPVVLSCALLGPLTALADDTTPIAQAEQTESPAKAEKAKKPKARVTCPAPTGSILAPRKKDCKANNGAKAYSPEDLRKSRDFDPASKAIGTNR